MKSRQLSGITALLTAAVLTAGLWGCGTAANSAAENSSTENTIVPDELAAADYTADDLTATWDDSSAVKITLDGSSATIEGSGASAENGQITITAAGTYVVSGTLSDGQLIVSAQSADVVHIVLHQASINCNSSSAIYGAQSDKIILTLADGTENEVSDGSEYKYDDANADEPDAAIFSKDDLTINGTGSLTVTGNYQDGIRSKDDLVIVSGTINVTAADDGIKGKDSITVKDGTITVNATGDGMKSNNDSDPEKGYILLENGSYNITAGNDGIQAESVLQIDNGSYQITTGGGSAAAATNQPEAPGGMMDNQARPEKMSTAVADQTADTTTETASMKGLKSSGAVIINDGILNIDCCDDTIHSNGAVTVSNGTFTLSSGDDGIHADAGLMINGGTIDIIESYEGLEGLTIDINGGTIQVNASDDGLNAAGGTDSNTSGNGFGADTFAANEDAYIRITDGYLYVNAAGDGIDSNGNLYVDGGEILVDGPVNGGDGALDYNGIAEITGGTIIAAGSAGMAEGFSDSSTQNSLMVYYSELQSAETLLSLSDADGNAIVSYTPSKEYQTVLISTPDLQTGTAYQLLSGETKLYDITIESVVSTIGENTGMQQMPGQRNNDRQRP